MDEIVDLTGNDDADENGAAATPAPPNPPGHHNMMTARRHIQQQLHLLRLNVDMPPVAKPSVRFGRGRGTGNLYRMYFDNDVVTKREQFRTICRIAAEEQGILPIPREQPVSIRAWFFLKRPAQDFISRRRVAGRLKPDVLCSEGTVQAVKPDIDNLCKFLLDSLTGVLFIDDAQVVATQLFKLRDSEGLCNGRIQLECSIASGDAIVAMLPNF